MFRYNTIVVARDTKQRSIQGGGAIGSYLFSKSRFFRVKGIYFVVRICDKFLDPPLTQKRRLPYYFITLYWWRLKLDTSLNFAFPVTLYMMQKSNDNAKGLELNTGSRIGVSAPPGGVRRKSRKCQTRFREVIQNE